MGGTRHKTFSLDGLILPGLTKTLSQVVYGEILKTFNPLKYMNEPLKIVTVGENGRMNQVLRVCVKSSFDFLITGAIHFTPSELPSKVIQVADVVVDFSTPSITGAVAEVCRVYRKPLAVGTTGHTDEQRAIIAKHVQAIPIVMASNFSTGVNVLFGLTRQAAEILGLDFDLEIVEAHHRMKKDAPSGTAKTLLKILQEVRNEQHQEMFPVHGREGMVCARSADESGIHSIRGGDVVGEHTVLFLGKGERVELTHKASSRETFALGALRAAKWVVGKPPGLYDMQDVLGLR